MDGRANVASVRPLLPGDPETVGAYRITGRLGEGGMGVVYLGTAPDGRAVAVKLVKTDLASDEGFVARFHDEVANAQRVASFCTAQVLDHGQHDGRAYMVTEFIEGTSLAQYVSAHGALPPGMLHGVAVGVAAALVAIHSAGLVHRDLKAANVLLSMSGPRVIDFGIARALDAATGHTLTGQLIGSPGWMAPEQVQNHEVTPKVDIFAWGCLVAFAGSGRHPYGQGSPSLMAVRVLHAEPDVDPLPAPLERLARAALSRDPHERPTAQDLLLALVGGGGGDAAVRGSLNQAWDAATERQAPPPSSAPRPAPPLPRTDPVRREVSQWAPLQGLDPERPPDDGKRRRLIAFIAVGVALIVLAAVIGWILRPDGGVVAKQTTTPTPSPAGPPALPAEALLVRSKTAGGFSPKCRSVIAKVIPGQGEDELTSGNCDMLPILSRDRTKIAFTRWNPPANKSAVFTMNTDGKELKQVTDKINGLTRVAWSGDGKQMAYVGLDGGTPQIFVLTLEGGGVRRLTSDGSKKDDPAWSPDGKLIAFWSNKSGKNQIYTLDVAEPGKVWKKLTDDPVGAVDPVWSPTDGTRIAYTHFNPDGKHDVYVMNADGGNSTPVAQTSALEMDPTWSPDGNRIAFHRGGGNQPRVYVVDVDGQNDQPLIEGDRAHPAWS